MVLEMELSLTTNVGWPLCQRVGTGMWVRVPPLRGL